MNNSKGSRIWYFMVVNMSDVRKRKLELYAQKYLEPILEIFPDLKYKIWLLLRKQGFIARTHPVYCIVVNENTVDCRSESRIRFITADMVMYFAQIEKGIPLLSHATEQFMSKQAVFFAVAKGFAYDFLKTYTCDCERTIVDCDFSYSFCNVKCAEIFQKSCKIYSDSELKAIAVAFESNCSDACFADNLDYKKELILQFLIAHESAAYETTSCAPANI